MTVEAQNLRDQARDAVAEALGDAYDCMRVWSAWGVGTMGPDDFSLVTDDSDRLAEITDAALSPVLPVIDAQAADMARLREALSDCQRLLRNTPKITRDMYVGKDRVAWGKQADAVLKQVCAALSGEGK